MSSEIQIELRESPLGLRPPCKRFFVNVLLSTFSERTIEAIVDTGAPFTVVPYGLWKEGLGFVTFAGDDVSPGCRTIRGITGDPQQCEFGWLHIIMSDEQPSFSDWLYIPAKLAETDDMPLLLGVCGLLDTYEVSLNKAGKCHINVPGTWSPSGTP